MRRIAGGLAFGVLLCTTATATAARYASPTGSGTVCSVDAPCSLAEAAGNAPSPGETVFVMPGSYTLASSLSAGNARIVGQTPRPVITLTDSSQLVLSGAGATLQHVAIEHTGTVRYALNFQPSDGLLEDVLVHSTQRLPMLIRGSAVVRDSVFRSDVDTAIEVIQPVSSHSTLTLRNLTAVGSKGLHVSVTGGSNSATINIANSIVRGTTADISMLSGGEGQPISIATSHSNYATVTGASSSAVVSDDGTKQTAPPVFKSGSDFHQLPSSPTVDAGTGGASGLGSVDPDGHARTIGSAPDIGADELQPPAVTTGAASDVQAGQATLAGTIDGQGFDGVAAFELGKTTTYGSTLPAGTAPGAVSATRTGLEPATTYHYRLTFTVAGITYRGADSTFTTPAQASGPGATETGSGSGSDSGPGTTTDQGSTTDTETADDTSPELTELALTRSAFVVGQRGVAIRYALSEAATLTFTLKRSVRGHRVRGRCAPGRPRRGQRGCNRFVAAGTFFRDSIAGAQRVAFSGRLGTEALVPGRYRLTAIATDAAGNASEPVVASFAISQP